TLGLYSPIWHTFINGEMSDFDPRLYVRPRPSGWAVALPWIIGVAGTALGVLRTLAHTGHLSFPHQSRVPVEVGYGLLGSLLAVPYLALILPVSLVAIVMTLERIRLLEDRVGVPLEHQLHPSRMVWWLLLPVVGGLVLIAREQGRLDRVWLRAEQLPQQRVATR
ncbi:MAG TPA: hypothetical protein VE219_03150, partial [Candidatus Sulfotelmatobacter sp.]|nr:hypothetical protein [Candidatus Sulfotelmatobacter sp.]